MDARSADHQSGRPAIASWRDLVDQLEARSGMWVGRPRYSLVRSFVGGFGAARGDGVLTGFQAWLSDQPEHEAVRNFGWPSLVLAEAFPGRMRTDDPAWTRDPTSDATWPRPPAAPVSEDDLTYPDDDELAIRALCRRWREFLDRTGS